MRRTVLVLCVLAFVAGNSSAQQLANGDFELQFDNWVTNYSGLPDMRIHDKDGDGDNELVFHATNLVNQWAENVLIVQDIPAEYINLNYGVALAADMGTTNMSANQDIRAYTKLEFLAPTGLIGHMTQSGEWHPSNYAVSNSFNKQGVIVRFGRELTNQMDDVESVRATLFLLRFDAEGGNQTGVGYFDNVNMGLSSAINYAPGLVNGGFEYDEWGWFEGYVSSREGWHIYDRDSDGEKELEFDSDGLSSQYANHLWAQEFDASLIDLTEDVVLRADLGASGLADGFRVFHKLEFATNGNAYSTTAQTIPGASVSAEYDSSLFAATNEIRLASEIVMTHTMLTDALDAAGGGSIDDVTMVRSVIFLMQFEATPPTPVGEGWFDNVSLHYTPKNPPTASRTKVLSSTEGTITWPSEIGETYRILHNDDLYDYQWTNVADSIAGLAGSTTWTATFPTNGNVGFYRIVRE